MKFSEALKLMESGKPMICGGVYFLKLKNNKLVFVANDAECVANVNFFVQNDWQEAVEKPKKVKKTFYRYYYKYQGDQSIYNTAWELNSFEKGRLTLVETETREFEVEE